MNRAPFHHPSSSLSGARSPRPRARALSAASSTLGVVVVMACLAGLAPQAVAQPSFMAAEDQLTQTLTAPARANVDTRAQAPASASSEHDGEHPATAPTEAPVTRTVEGPIAAPGAATQEAPDGLREPSDPSSAEPEGRSADPSAVDDVHAHNRRILAAVGLAGGGAVAAVFVAQLGLVVGALALGGLGQSLATDSTAYYRSPMASISSGMLVAALAMTFAPPLAVAAAVMFASWWKGGRFWWALGVPAAAAGVVAFPILLVTATVGTALVLFQFGDPLFPNDPYNKGTGQILWSAFIGVGVAMAGSGLAATAAAAAVSHVELLGPALDAWIVSDDEE